MRCKLYEFHILLPRDGLIETFFFLLGSFVLVLFEPEAVELLIALADACLSICEIAVLFTGCEICTPLTFQSSEVTLPTVCSCVSSFPFLLKTHCFTLLCKEHIINGKSVLRRGHFRDYAASAPRFCNVQESIGVL